MTLVPATKLGVDVPVPPLATGNKPTTPVVNGNPVALVNVTEVGVPRTGVTSVGDVERTTEPEPVEVVTPVPPLATAKVPATVTAPVVVVEGVRPVVPKLMEVTPLFVIVTAPVALETLIPVPATADVTPVLAIVILPLPLVTLIAVPAVKVDLASVPPVVEPINNWPSV